MSKWLMWLLAGLTLLALASWLWSQDEALSPQAQAWLEQVAADAGDSPAYYHLLGMDAPSGRDPQTEGRTRIALYQQGLLEQAPQLQADTPALVLPDDALCVLGTPGCLQRLLEEPEQRLAWLSQHRELLQRYQQLVALPAPQTLAPVSLNEPIANYAVVLWGNRLRALQVLQLAEEGKADEALATLEEDVRVLRGWLANADNLIMKMATVSLLAQNLDALAVLYQAGLIAQPALLQPLSGDERSLLSPMQREFAMVASGFTELIQQAHLKEEFGVSGWRLRWMYKPQMSINDSWSAYAHVASQSLLSAQAFGVALSEAPPPVASTWRRLRNPVGGILVAVALPDFRRYLARLHDLDAKLVLFNRLGRPEQALANPYQPNEQPAWDAERQLMCFDGPLADAKQIRCLPAIQAF